MGLDISVFLIGAKPSAHAKSPRKYRENLTTPIYAYRVFRLAPPTTTQEYVMGLDMYADSIAPGVSYVKALLTKSRVAPPKQIHQWRKHADLHAWMVQLWLSKTRSFGSTQFNRLRVRLSQKDLDDLEHDICEGLLPKGMGFFWGESDGSEREDDLAFVKKARKEIARGRRIYYEASW